MNVVIFRDLQEEHWPSMEVYADQLVRGLSRVCPPAVTVNQVAPAVTRRFSWIGSIPKVRHIVTDLRITKYVKYPLVARRSQADINHIIDHSYGHLARFLDPARTVVTFHDLAPIRFNNTKHLDIRLWLWGVRGALRARCIIADSEHTASELVNLFGTPADKITVVYLGVDEIFQPDVSQDDIDHLKRQYNLPAEPLILHVGNCEPRKNVEAILRVLHHLITKTPLRPHFVQAGGIFSSSQKRMISELGIEGFTTQLSGIQVQELVQIYNMATVLLLPSLYEGFGLPALEAMACGTPVVASNATSLPEVLGDAAILVNPQDIESLVQAIYAVLSDEDLHKSLHERGLRRARLFSWETTARRTYEVYESIYSANTGRDGARSA